ncbi:MAG: DEAD/DEAH box helicase [Actinomycetota bacterium]
MTGGADRGFSLDRFQLEAIEHLDAGRSVLVAAPTGSGKTVVAEHAIDRALEARKRAFYTAPIKALSNQKYRDLAERIGSSRVGLLTGDNAINADADIVVMTTEVLRNMLYEGRDLDDLAFVIMDEVHYLEDTFRGPVWEEVILHLPAHVKMVCLSATVSNTDELAGWLESIRGETGTVVERKRPVELTNLYAVGDRRGHRLHVISTLVEGEANREGHRFDPDLRRRGRGGGPDRKQRDRPPWSTPNRLEVLDHLEDHDLLPVIWFVFSRKGCDEAAVALERAGARYTDAHEADRIRAIAEERLAGLPTADLAVLDTSAWRNRLERGIASHHAGLVPAFKETVEQCFAEGLVRVVFATETLALGVNLPARSVVIDKLTKFTGETHEQLTPAQFTQLTGRAGRRGIDDRGHAIVPWSPFTRFDQVAGLASSRSFRLRSAFRPTYNMAVNLLQTHSADAARALLANSFAQYQADVNVARLEQRLVRERNKIAELEPVVADLPPEPTARAADDADAISEAVSRLRPGDLITDDDGERFAVLGVSWRKGGRARLRLVNEGAREARWELADLTIAPHTIGRIELPFPMAPERIDYRQDVATRIRRSGAGESARAQRRRTKRRDDPRALLDRARQEVSQLERRARRDGASIARQFDAVSEVLRERGHLDSWVVTESGFTLAAIYNEVDLLIAEALTDGLLDGLTGPELASLASTFTYEHRSAEPPPAPWFPSPTAAARFRRLEQIAHEINEAERRAGVTESRRPDAGFAPVAHSWAAGESLAVLLDHGDDMTAGDFVRNIKQVIDLLGQIAGAAADAATRTTARAAADAIHRGVVALSGSVTVV